MRSVAPMRAAKVGYIIMSILFCAAGGALIVTPEVYAPWLGRALGIGMIGFGAIKLVGYFSRDLFRLAFQYDLAFGTLLIVLGAVTLTHLNEAMGFFSILVGIPVLSDGLFKIQIAMDSKRFGIGRWWLVLALAALTCAAGMFLMLRPAAGARALAITMGAALLMDGVLNLGVVLCTVKIIRHQQPDVIDVEYRKIGKDE